MLISILVVLIAVCGIPTSSSENITTPQLPRQFRLSLESINTFTKKGRFIKTYYDFTNNLYRVDLDARNTEPPRIGKGLVTDIRNFTSGNAYRYSSTKKLCANYTSPKCTARLIRTTNVGNWRVSTPCGVLSLYEESAVPKVYSGNQTVRNALCDVWTSTRKNWPENRTGELTFKWFFLRNPWLYNNQEQVPLRLEVDGQVAWNSSLNASIAFRISFFAFETNYWSEKFFEVPDYCPGQSDGGDKHDDKTEQDQKMYTRKYVIQVAALTGVVCFFISLTTCGIYSGIKRIKNKRNRFY